MSDTNFDKEANRPRVQRSSASLVEAGIDSMVSSLAGSGRTPSAVTTCTRNLMLFLRMWLFVSLSWMLPAARVLQTTSRQSCS